SMFLDFDGLAKRPSAAGIAFPRELDWPCPCVVLDRMHPVLLGLGIRYLSKGSQAGHDLPFCRFGSRSVDRSRALGAAFWQDPITPHGRTSGLLDAAMSVGLHSFATGAAPVRPIVGSFQLLSVLAFSRCAGYPRAMDVGLLKSELQ